MSEFIDLTPSWAGLLPAMFAVLESDEAPVEAKNVIKEEFMRLAEFADKKNEEAEEDAS